MWESDGLGHNLVSRSHSARALSSSTSFSLPSTAPPSLLHVFLRVFTCLWVAQVILTCFHGLYTSFTRSFAVFICFWALLGCMCLLSLSFGLIHIFCSLLYLFALWVELFTVPCCGCTHFQAQLSHKVKPSEVLPPWLPLFQQKRCLPVAI
jgi:hypothetical protein